jgi:hypothetical protein
MEENTSKAAKPEYYGLTKREQQIFHELLTYIEVARGTAESQGAVNEFQTIQSTRISRAAVRLLAKLVPEPPYAAPHAYDTEEELAKAEQQYKGALKLCLERFDDPFIQINNILLCDKHLSGKKLGSEIEEN